MPSESKPLLAAQTEKPNHYKYLKEFRVEQCPSFLQHKCTQHRPFTCFHWHFNNQRRRRPVRKRDGSFNYSADNYCTKYNETSGICEDGDECPYLHRTAGDTERRYHLRYYKTCMCVHDTDARGLCTKNGAHCAFAHGGPDLRPPVLDVRELHALDHPPDMGEGDAAAPNALDRERNLMNEDPKWQDTNYVLSSYKTEPCKRPPRLCRQGYACPQYHNSKDKRRSPRKYKYRSTPCPNVKHGEEWGEPSNCEAGDACGYCHTRTEQQFHPEIYKSTKCNDVQQAGYCPRGLFCAFAHVEREYSNGEGVGAAGVGGSTVAGDVASRVTAEEVGRCGDHYLPLECGTSFAELLSTALPPDRKDNGVEAPHANGGGPDSECASTSSGGSGGGAARRDDRQSIAAHALAAPPAPAAVWPPRAQPFDATVLQEVVGNALDDLHLDDPLNLMAALDRDLADPEPQLGGSAPVNIPRPPLRGFSPPSHAAGGSPLPFLRYAHVDVSQGGFHSGPTAHSAFSAGTKPASFGGGGFDFGAASPVGGGASVGGGGGPELSRLREEVVASRAAVARWDERIAQARAACEAWRRELDDAHRKAALAERQRDEALLTAINLRRELESNGNSGNAPTGSGETALTAAGRGGDRGRGGSGAGSRASGRELRGMPLATLKALQAQTRAELEEIEEALYQETAKKCMVCEEKSRTVTFKPCNHLIVCATCSDNTDDCPYCQTPVLDRK